MRNPAAEELRDWTPIMVYRNDAGTFVDWCHLGSTRFTKPFFNDTIFQLMGRPFNVLFRHQIAIERLPDLAGDDFVAPSGFVFHMSRCGSTLVSQMLAALNANIVISEAPPIDSIVASNHDSVDESEIAQRLHSMISIFGRRRHPEERNYFVKFDAWNILDIAFVRRVFPDVPWIFLYRNPVEVIVSQMRQRGSHMVPGAMEQLLPEMSLAQALQMPAEEYCAKILAKFCEAAFENRFDEKGLFVNYAQLPDAVPGVIAQHFHLSFSPDELDQMNVATQFDAKTPQLNFEPDGERKRNEATEAARQAAATWIEPLYEKLESHRTATAK